MTRENVETGKPHARLQGIRIGIRSACNVTIEVLMVGTADDC
jgi:hypothetical protein